MPAAAATAAVVAEKHKEIDDPPAFLKIGLYASQVLESSDLPPDGLRHFSHLGLGFQGLPDRCFHAPDENKNSCAQMLNRVLFLRWTSAWVENMLVLTRKPGESIRIEPNKTLDPATPVGELFAAGPIEVRIGNIDGERVRVAIGADPRFVILRDELADEE